MPHTTQQRALAGAGLGLALTMSAVVPLVTRSLPPLAGYLTVLTIYWGFYCLPVAWVFGRGPDRVSVELRVSSAWIPATAFVLPLVVLFAADPARWIGSEPQMLAIAVVCASINGPLEELAWRRTFRANSEGRLSYEMLGLALFTLWHVPLYFAQGVSFDHGAAGLVGGALLMGALWTVMTRASDSIGWPIVSHALVNVAAFLPFFATNFAP